MDTEGGGESGTSKSQSRPHMNIYLTDSSKEAIVDFVKDYEELYDNTNEHFNDKTRKDCLWERFASSHNPSLKVCKNICSNPK